jgi:hypothetical protein
MSTIANNATEKFRRFEGWIRLGLRERVDTVEENNN